MSMRMASTLTTLVLAALQQMDGPRADDPGRLARPNLNDLAQQARSSKPPTW
jgi:hypothetical protein